MLPFSLSLSLSLSLSFFLSLSFPLSLYFERFNDKVHLILDEEVSMATSSVGKHQFDYLFLVWQSGV